MMKIDSFSHNPYDSNTGMLDWWDEGVDTGYNTYPSTLTEQLCYSTIPTDEEEPELTDLIVVAKYLITDLSQPTPLLSCGFNDEMTELYHFYDVYDSLEIDGEEVEDATQYEIHIEDPELHLEAYAIVYQFDSEGEHIVKLKIKDDFNKIVNSGFGIASTLVSISLPNGITSIGYGSFYECTGLTSITIPNSVTSIGGSAFARSGLTSISIPNSVISIGGAAFEGCTSLTSITIPNGVTEIGQEAFVLSGLTSITIPNSVTSIGGAAFGRCYGLTSITIPNSVTSIGQSAFIECSGLTSVNLGNGVTSIGNYAFQNCSNLVSITSLATTAPEVESSSFEGVKSNGTLYVPVGSSGYDDWMSESQSYLGYYNWTLERTINYKVYNIIDN